MLRTRRLLVPPCVFVALLVGVSFVGGQAPVPAKKDVPPVKIDTSPDAVRDRSILAEIKNHSEIMANLTYLSDVIGPRLTGSASLKRANEWAAERMKSYGLADVRLEGWTIPAGWERGPTYARIIEPDNGRTLLVASMGWTPGTKGKIIGDVVIIKANNSEELKQYKGKLKDAIILRGPPTNVRPITDTSYSIGGGPPAGGRPGGNRQRAESTPKKEGTPKEGTPKEGTPKEGTPRPETPPGLNRPERGDFTAMMAFRRELAEFLRAEGAAVMLSDAGKPHGLLTTTGGWGGGRDRASSSEPMPSLFVAHEHYALLYRLASRPAPARTRMEVEIQNKLVPGPIAVYNTVGEIKGSEKPDEFVILGAHLDSWDLAQGTTDNGTGSSIVLETARVLAKSGVKPKRTIRFVLFTGEEQGLYGSRAYVEKHKDEMAKTSMALVHDTGTGKVIGIGTQGFDAVKPILERELTVLKEIGLADINTRGMGGSDHASFDRAGVPGFAVQQDMAEYRFTHHSQSDTLDKANEVDLIQGAQVMAVTALRVADLDNLLPRERRETPRQGGFGERRGAEKKGAEEKKEKDK